MAKVRIKHLFTLMCIVYGAIFIASAIFKLIDLNEFAHSIGKFKILSPHILPFFKYGIPLIEILLGILIVIQIKPEITTRLIVIMVIGFTTLLILKLAEGEKVSCGCFGSFSSGNIDYLTILRNAILIIFGVLIASYYEAKKNDNVTKISKTIIQRFKKAGYSSLILFLCFQSIIFAVQNRALKDRVNIAMASKDVLKPNETVSNFYGYNLGGEYVNPFNNKNNYKMHILFLMSVRCKTCSENLHNWVEINNNADNDNVNVFGVIIDSLTTVKKYVIDKKLNFEIFAVPDLEFQIDYKVFLTPQTLIIDDKFRVIENWTGKLDSIMLQNIYSIIN